MNREVKFRGRDIENENQWRYGSLITYPNGNCVIVEFDNEENELSYDVDVDTVGQYTGLKDKNGREIYEGDIIKTRRYGVVNGCCNSQGADKFIVKYMDAQFYVENNLRHFYLQDSKCNEIIGNIHENSNLLK